MAAACQTSHPSSSQEERVVSVGSVPHSHEPKLCHMSMASSRDTRKAECIVTQNNRRSAFLGVLVVIFIIALFVTLIIFVTYCQNTAV